MATFSVLSYNCEGVRRSKDYIAHVLNNTSCDILCLQEIWTLDNTIEILGTIHKDYSYTGISGVSNNDFIRGRPSGGVGILYKKCLAKYITCIKIDNRRICGLKLCMDNNFSCMLLNVYLPCDNYSNNNVSNQYVNCIECIESMFNMSECNSFICCGDYNTSFQRNNAQSRYLSDFVNRNNLITSWEHVLSQEGFTYVNHALGHQSTIDHFIVSRNIYDFIVDNYVMCDPTNPSNHYIVQLAITCLSNDVYACSVPVHSDIIKTCAWDKATPVHVANYSRMLDGALGELNVSREIIHCSDVNCQSSKHKEYIDILCAQFIECCITTGFDCIPLINHKAKNIPGWTDHAKPEREQSLFWHWVWSEAGKPFTGIIYEIMKRTRHKYHYAVRRLKKDKIDIQKQKLADNLCDSKVFWRNLKNLNPVSKTLPIVVDKKQGASEISKVFVQKYQSLYTSVPTNDTERQSIHRELTCRLSCDSDIDCFVTPCIIGNCMSKLKKNKSDGDKGFNSNHLLYGGQRIKVILSLLFNAMLIHGYYPSELLKSTIVSLPKDRTASLSNSDNYRGISLFNSICKLFDYVIIELAGDMMHTSDMQFGFKEQHSTTMCTLVLREVVSEYLAGNSDVYCCLLDASKAFDKVHYGKLFSLLISKSISPKVLRLIVDCYVRQQARVSWGDYSSGYFKLLNGVKQGGVLSPKLFTLYIDSLLVELRESGYGCHMGNTFAGALSYADDITLLCPSIRGLNKMLKICSTFADNFDITFNSKKTVCIKFGNKVSTCDIAQLNGNTIDWVDNIKHLGFHLNTTLSDELDCRSKISAFIGYVNKLNVNFGQLKGKVLCTLFKTYCCSYYGCQMWRLGSLYFNRVCTSWNVGVRRMLNLPYTTHRYMLGPLLGQPHISIQLQKRCARFLYGIKCSKNKIIAKCFLHASWNASTPLGHNIAFLRNKYGVDVRTDNLMYCIDSICAPNLSADECNSISQLRLLLCVRWGTYSIDGFSVKDIETFITLLSTG